MGRREEVGSEIRGQRLRIMKFHIKCNPLVSNILTRISSQPADSWTPGPYTSKFLLRRLRKLGKGVAIEIPLWHLTLNKYWKLLLEPVFYRYTELWHHNAYNACYQIWHPVLAREVFKLPPQKAALLFFLSSLFCFSSSSCLLSSQDLSCSKISTT